MRKVLGRIVVIGGSVILCLSLFMTLMTLSLSNELNLGDGPEPRFYLIIISGVILVICGIVILRLDGIKNFIRKRMEVFTTRKREQGNKKQEEEILNVRRKYENRSETVSKIKQKPVNVWEESVKDLDKYDKHIHLFRHRGGISFNLIRRILGAVMFFGVLISIPFTAEPLFTNDSLGIRMLFLLLYTVIFFTGAGLMGTANGVDHIAKVTAFATNEFQQIYYITYPKSVSEEVPKGVSIGHIGKLISTSKMAGSFAELEKVRSENINRDNFAEEVEKSVNHKEADLQGADVVLMENPVIKKRYLRYTLIQYRQSDEIKQALLFKSNEGYGKIMRYLKKK